MQKKRVIKLLTKTTFIYLIFTFIAFFSSAVFLTNETDEFIEGRLENRFRRYARHIEHHIQAGKGIDRLPPSVRIWRLASPADPSAYPAYSDTLIYNAEMDELQRFRKKTILLNIEGHFYRVEMVKAVEDFLRLRDDIFGSLIPAFILLALGIVLFNYLLSGYFFRPFNKILDVMKTYKVGRNKTVSRVPTSTAEFHRMQELFHKMIDRIEYDYRHLKEYTENMAHEMQTPLSIVRSKVEILMADDALMPKHAQTVKTIYDETNHLSKLSQTLNLITRIENGEFSNFKEIKTKDVIEKHVSAVRELAHLKLLSIETDLSENHYFYMDPFLLDMALKNLLRNAINYGQTEGPVRICTNSDQLSISNYGPPLDIPEEKMFERFYRKTNRQKSTGLGLSLVKKVCDVSLLNLEYRYHDGQHFFYIRPGTGNG